MADVREKGAPAAPEKTAANSATTTTTTTKKASGLTIRRFLKV